MNNQRKLTDYSAVRITIKGRVQGVGFRYFIARIAYELDLHGYAKNLFNGDVEIYAEGKKEFLTELIKNAKLGPSHSYVETANVEWLEFKNKYDNFEVR